MAYVLLSPPPSFIFFAPALKFSPEVKPLFSSSDTRVTKSKPAYSVVRSIRTKGTIPWDDSCCCMILIPRDLILLSIDEEVT